LLLALLCAATPLLSGASGDYVRIILEAPAPSPFSEVRYEVIDRGPAVSAVHRRSLPGHGEALHAMGLLTRPEAEALRAALAGAGAMTLPDALSAAPDPGAVTWLVELGLDGREHRFRVTDPINQPDRRYWAVVEGARSLVKRIAGELPFRNVFFDSRHMGWLTVQAVPVAQVTLNGFDTKLETPIYSYEVEAGKHTVRLATSDGRYDRTYQVRVDPSGTTHLAVDLR
jgi:hypothetical protein